MTLASPPPLRARDRHMITDAQRGRVQLSPAERVTLRALTACVLDGAPQASVSLDVVAEAVERRLGTLHPHKAREMRQALMLLGSRLLVLVTIGKVVPFDRLSAGERARCFGASGTSRVPQLRSAHQAWRRLILATHYGQRSVSESIGYPGPLHTRSPMVSWEGPLPERTAERVVASVAGGVEGQVAPPASVIDEPVVRGHADLRAAVPPTVLPSGIVAGSDMTGDIARTADVVVIGTGAGGAVAAARLAEAGLQVVMLEEGHYYGAADFTEEEGPLTERLYAEGALRGTEDLALMLMQGRAVGGSTTVNWMIMLRTPDYVLEEWARHHGAEGLSPSALAPVFARIEHEVHARIVPDDAHSPNNRAILDGARVLGWRASSAMINARNCVRSGFCGVGCRYDAKQGTLMTFVPRALAAGATLITDARAEHLGIRERDGGRGRPPLKRVTARVRHQENGEPSHTVTIDAPIVVLAAGAVGTPVLLQRSGMGGGGVGRWLRLHPTTAVLGFHGQDITASSGIPLSTMCDEFIRWNGTDYGFWIECPPLHPALGAVALPGFGAPHAATMQRFRTMSSFIALTRDGADHSRSSGSVLVDRGGRVRIRYRLGPEDGQRVRASIEAAARLHLAAGASEVHTLHTRPVVFRSDSDLPKLLGTSIAPNDLALFSAHVNGTCRLGTNPSTSGASPDGERHGVRGLYIADGSLLPTSPGVNPQETIMALASVMADRISAQHSRR